MYFFCSYKVLIKEKNSYFAGRSRKPRHEIFKRDWPWSEETSSCSSRYRLPGVRRETGPRSRIETWSRAAQHNVSCYFKLTQDIVQKRTISCIFQHSLITCLGCSAICTQGPSVKTESTHNSVRHLIKNTVLPVLAPPAFLAGPRDGVKVFGFHFAVFKSARSFTTDGLWAV